jgi:hypothetical protein
LKDDLVAGGDGADPQIVDAGLLRIDAMAGTAAFAQTEPAKAEDHSFKSVRGHEVLPQKGEWALGVSATGFLGYMGNLMNNTAGNTAPAFNTANTANAFAVGNLGGWGISCKYMKTATMAYSVRVLANVGNFSYSNYVAKNMTIAIVGDVTLADVKRLAEQPSWRRGGSQAALACPMPGMESGGAVAGHACVREVVFIGTLAYVAIFARIRPRHQNLLLLLGRHL